MAIDFRAIKDSRGLKSFLRQHNFTVAELHEDVDSVVLGIYYSSDIDGLRATYESGADFWFTREDYSRNVWDNMLWVAKHNATYYSAFDDVDDNLSDLFETA